MNNRHKRYGRNLPATKDNGNTEPTSAKELFAIGPVLINILVIVMLGVAYLYTSESDIFPHYNVYINWAIGILICYNILVASVRSFFLPTVCFLLSGAVLFFIQRSQGMYLSTNLPWLILIISIIGLLISYSRLL